MFSETITHFPMSSICPPPLPNKLLEYKISLLNLAVVVACASSGVYGSVPQVIIDEQDDIIQKFHDRLSELDSLQQVAVNAQKQYVRSRGQPSPESIKRAKQLPQNVPMHPLFRSLCSQRELETTQLLDSLKSYKPAQVHAFRCVHVCIHHPLCMFC